MKFIVTSSFRFLAVVVFVAVSTACTTSTKLIQSEISVDKNSSRTEAVSLTSKSNEIKDEAEPKIIAQEYGRSIEQLTSQAEQGQSDAQYSLGYAYYNGLGTERNDSLALQWLASAAQQGNTNAIEALRRIAVANTAAAQQAERIEAPEPMPMIEIAGNDESQAVNARVTMTPGLPQATTDAMARTLTLNKQTPLTESEQWIMAQPGKRYTIQLVATTNKAAMLRFINKNNLQNNAVYYKTKRKSDDWYTLILGSFETLSAAQKSVSQLSSSLRKIKPWVKPISGIHKALAVR